MFSEDYLDNEFDYTLPSSAPRPEGERLPILDSQLNVDVLEFVPRLVLDVLPVSLPTSPLDKAAAAREDVRKEDAAKESGKWWGKTRVTSDW